jgi:hypothetical protein
MIDQLSVFLENKSGRLAELTRALGDSGVNMHALMVADTADFGIIRIICDTPARAKAILESEGFGVSVTEVSAIEVPDRPGGLADVLETLSAAGHNIEYAYCFVGASGRGAVDVLKVDAPEAEGALSSAGFRVMSPEELYTPDGEE